MKPAKRITTALKEACLLGSFLFLLFSFSNRALLKSDAEARHKAATGQVKQPSGALVPENGFLASYKSSEPAHPLPGFIFATTIAAHLHTPLCFNNPAARAGQCLTGKKISSRLYYHLFSIKGEPPATT